MTNFGKFEAARHYSLRAFVIAKTTNDLVGNYLNFRFEARRIYRFYIQVIYKWLGLNGSNRISLVDIFRSNSGWAAETQYNGTGG